MKRKLLLNRWKTPDGTVLVSYHTHDYVSHIDKNGETYFVDGGSDYIRMSLNDVKMTDMCIYTDSPYEEIRKSICRGTFDKGGHRIWIPMCNMSTPHLENCITYVIERHGYKNNHHLFLYMRELIARWEADIYVDEKEYTADDLGVEDCGLPNSVRKCEDRLSCDIEQTLESFKAFIGAGLHTDNDAIVMLLKHALNLYEADDFSIKDIDYES
jgi:hypothetical protein